MHRFHSFSLGYTSVKHTLYPPLNSMLTLQALFVYFIVEYKIFPYFCAEWNLAQGFFDRSRSCSLSCFMAVSLKLLWKVLSHRRMLKNCVLHTRVRILLHDCVSYFSCRPSELQSKSLFCTTPGKRVVLLLWRVPVSPAVHQSLIFITLLV